MRAPLLVAAVMVAAGIAVGVMGSGPIGGGPLFSCAAAGAGLAAALALRPAGAGRAVAALLLMAAGALLGLSGRADLDAACAWRLPEQGPAWVFGRIESALGERVRLSGDSVRVGAQTLPCGGALLARVDPAAGAAVMGSAGGGVAVRGRWWSPPAAHSRIRRPGVLMADSVLVTDAANGSPGGRALFPRLRAAAQRKLEGLYGPQAALATSLLVAQRDGLDRDVRDRYARAGLSHLLAISGLHVGLVAGMLMLLGGAARLGRRTGAIAAGTGTLLYVVFLGAPASAVRAALQIVLTLAALAVQRPARGESLLAAAALTILALDPVSLLEPGFQLSFAGVGGLLALRRPLLDRLRWLETLPPRRAMRWVADGVATSLAATVATAPVAAWHFGQVAPVGVAANLLAIPLLGALVPTLALSLGAGLLWEPAGHYLAGAAGIMMTALDRIALIASNLPGGGVAWSGRSAATLTTALLVGWWLARGLGRVRRAIRVATLAAGAAAVLVLAPVRAPTDRLELHMIDVGQGDAIALRTPGRRWLLVDAGVAGSGHDAGERVVVPYLRARGARRLDALVLTHADLDHFGGAPAVIRSLRPAWIGDPGLAAGKQTYLALLRAAADANADWLALAQGAVLELDGVRVEILHPRQDHGPVEDANDASVVALVRYGEFSALLTGDAPAFVEESLVARYGARLEADVLKVGHHGSSTSTSEALLQASGARVALISAGRRNRYGHPHRLVVERLRAAGVRVLRTDRVGSVVVRAARNGEIDIETQQKP